MKAKDYLKLETMLEKIGLLDKIDQIEILLKNIPKFSGGGGGGESGREIELQKSSTHIQWHYVGELTWIDLVALSEITGDQGPAGPNEVSTDTDTNITGLLKGNGTKVAQAVAGTDYEPAKGTDDNFVTDAEKANLHAPHSDDQDLSGYALISGLHFPFYKSDGTLDTIALTADQKIPFFKSNGTQDNIALTT